VITPRHTRLVRVPHLHGFRYAIVDLVAQASAAGEPPLVLVPTRAAARQVVCLVQGRDSRRRNELRADVGEETGASAVTRDELYDRLHQRLQDAPRRLTAVERDVLMQRAARESAAAVPDLPFRIRPGIVGEMLRFYDHLRRQSQQVSRFEELLSEALCRDDDADRGARRLREQTAFLAAAFKAYERLVRDSGGCDEHLLRDRLIAGPSTRPARHVIVTVQDWIADPDGLYVADFDLLARIPGLGVIDIIATEGVLRSGFDERLHNWWPGIEEIRPDTATDASRPTLVVPPGAAPDQPWWTFRDREEELVSIARKIKADEKRGPVPVEQRAVVFKAPLPYLYLAAEVFPAAGIAYQTSDALPLAVEPTAAALDLILDAVASRFVRTALIALLRSPHFVFLHEGREISRASIGALNSALSQRQYLGDLERLQALAAEWRANHVEAMPALSAALSAAQELAATLDPHSASDQLRRLEAFWSAHLRPIEAEDSTASAREQRARAAIAQTLSELASVHASYDDEPWTIDDLAPAVRRALEDQTFAPAPAATGLQLLDDRAVRYGSFEEVSIVGVIEPDWPERPRRNIFYPPALLRTLGWPPEKDRRAAADARFLELLSSSSRHTRVSTFTLDDEALVSRSTELDDIPRARLSTVAHELDQNARVFLEEALSLEPPDFGPLEGPARTWAELRQNRSPADSPEFHGQVRQVGHQLPDLPDPPDLSVSSIETYLDCPFKYFAQHVLKLDDEPDDEEVMDPRKQGQFMHQVFETFFRAWQAQGARAITPDNLDTARTLFAATVDRELERLPRAEAGLERTRLLGSPAAAGLGEAVLRMEAERPAPVVERLLEHKLQGEFTFATDGGARTIRLRGKADRLDLLADGTFRLIDYKLGWPPNRARALQLPVYGICAEQQLQHRGRRWQLGEAVYLAFKGPRRVVPLFGSAADRDKVLRDAQQRLVDSVDAIGRGEFPPTPDDVWRCESCCFSSVCRKDYVGDV
jgi:RecB family exonuclease